MEGWRDGDGGMEQWGWSDAGRLQWSRQRGHVQLLQAPLPKPRAPLPTPEALLFCFQTCHCLQAVLI